MNRSSDTTTDAKLALTPCASVLAETLLASSHVLVGCDKHLERRILGLTRSITQEFKSTQFLQLY
jgi:hypothetical protein